ncbi:hypothetical protein ACFPYJ_22935 [Paenibacillus solisilvae]|uniref:Uncharacterized protein n=1 Tax=Paenibacillus solisilvae TaxID=2486751 RepID=A0ABW0W2Q7_9BACL
MKLVSDVYEIKKNQDGVFSKSVVITLPFDKTQIDFAKSTVGIYWLNEQTHQWVQLTDLKTDQTNGTVSGSVNHFTKFAVLVSDIAKPEVPPTSKAIQGHWTETNIRDLVELGAISGYPDKKTE